jgi:hypothetical protein
VRCEGQEGAVCPGEARPAGLAAQHLELVAQHGYLDVHVEVAEAPRPEQLNDAAGQ